MAPRTTRSQASGRKTGDAAEPSPPGAENKPRRAAPWLNRGYAQMILSLGRVPPDATTLDIYTSLVPLTVLSIDILENGVGERTGAVRVRLKPPNVDYWYDRAWRLQIQGPPQRSELVSANVDSRGFRGELEDSIKTPLHRWVRAQVDLDLAMLGQGFMHQKRTMMVMDEVEHRKEVKIRLRVNFKRRELSIFASRYLEEPLPSLSSAGPPRTRRFFVEYRVDVRFPWIKGLREQQFPGGRVCVVLALDSPPEYWCKVRDAAKTHGSDHLSWNGMEQWARMASLTINQRTVRDAAVALNGTFPQGQAVDLGRWTTFRLGLDQDVVGEWHEISEHLHDYDIRVKACPEFRFVPRDDRNMWNCVQISSPSVSSIATPASNMYHLSRGLSFEASYQLEVCVSRNLLHESTLDVVFLESLTALAPDRATRMLEYVAERGKRVYQPHSIFRDPKAASYWRKSPSDASLDKDRAVYVRKAIVTPTTILYSTPALEAGNRVLRNFRDHHDRFLRVQFTDELLIGRLNGGRDSKRTDECFSRAFRALKNGIRVGGRHFEFLAFGNSQLRENGAYFFAPTDLISCQDIRDWMGDFSKIKTVAKYAARLGQCLSTTRPVPTFGVPTTVQRIADVEHGGFCFTDGVGKISKWWARVIASHLRLEEVPSAVQFRMGGCKGILVVWPDVPSGQIVQIRPSQEKFPTTGNTNVLEIVRCSETATATLNQQTIILLTSLGVAPSVFLDLLHEELAGLDAVMKDPGKAVAQLTMRVDQNHITPVIADMVKAGFMASDEPFIWAMLQLWRSWTLKSLKEKARITVEKSAFVLGCVDETDTLRGSTQQPKESLSDNEELEFRDRDPGLAQIFLQIPDVENSSGGFVMLARGNSYAPKIATKYKVITGLCLVGRNPSLHPGDLRVVEAVDVPALHHLRDVVVFPRVGDRDIPSMCSGGDLDGDDYFVFWDERLLPPLKFRNYEAMSYDAAREPDVDEVTPRHLISFFVQHMKHDTLPRIAVAHRAYADQLDGGAMNPRCLELAQLHSQAVDYAKTGVPALMPHRLSPRDWPHWMGRTFKRTYTSRSALGRIYDEVQVESFEPAYDKPFDSRILGHYPSIDMNLLRRARRIKTQYDLAIRRAMAQKDIESEFELWSGFAMSRPRVGSDYKFAEDLGRVFKVITTRFRRVCLREVNNSLDISELGPFVAAMYKVTYEELRIALHEFALSRHRNHADAKRDGIPDDQSKQSRFTHHIAPLISFPWLFSHQLATIAKASEAASASGASAGDAGNAEHQKQQDALLTVSELAEMEYSVQNGVPTHHGIPLDISAFDGSREEADDGEEEEANFQPMWTLPPGKSEGDVVIDPIVSMGPSEAHEEEAACGSGDYDFLMARIGRGTFDSTTTNSTRGHETGVNKFPWTEIEDDVLSTSSEESLGDALEKIVIRRDDDDEGGSDGSVNGKGSLGTEDNAVPKAVDAPSSDLPQGLRGHSETAGASASTSKRDVESSTPSREIKQAEAAAVPVPEDVGDEANEDDIFAEVDNLFGERKAAG